MIKKIDNIKGSGVWSGFQWDANCEEFRKRNLIFGYNGTGKSTFARLIRHLEIGVTHETRDDIEFDIALDEQPTQSWRTTSINSVRVFNREYIKDNIYLDQSKAKSIAYLGADNIELSLKIESIENEIVEAETQRAQIESKRTSTKYELDEFLTESARTIAGTLGITNYNRPKLKQAIDKAIADNIAPLEDANVTQLLLTVNNKNELEHIAISMNVFQSLNSLLKRSEKALATAPDLQKRSERISSTPQVESWVRAGINLHKGSDNCLYCGQTLPPSLLIEFQRHFSQRYANHLQEIIELRNIVRAELSQKFTITEQSRFYESFQNEAKLLNNEISDLIQKRRDILQQLDQLLENKNDDIFTTLTLPEFEDPFESLKNSITRLHQVIGFHNNRVANSRDVIEQATATLIEHFALRAAQEISYSEKKQHINQLDEEINTLNLKIRKLAADLSDCKSERHNITQAVNIVNTYLKSFFGHEGIRLSIETSDSIAVQRNGHWANDLSEGEQTVICFSYFMAQLMDGRVPIRDSIIVIDDPVSSLDSNHLFNVYAIMRTVLAEAKQVFVLTHNFEMFSLVKEWFYTSSLKPSDKVGMYKLWKTTSTAVRIGSMPEFMIKSRSEFSWLFSKLLDYKRSTQSGEDTEENNYEMPNFVRRIIEAYTSILMPSGGDLKSRMNKMFPNAINCERVYKFINTFSHNNDEVRALRFVDASECSVVVNIVLAAMEAFDERYFRELVELTE